MRIAELRVLLYLGQMTTDLHDNGHEQGCLESLTPVGLVVVSGGHPPVVRGANDNASPLETFVAGHSRREPMLGRSRSAVPRAGRILPERIRVARRRLCLVVGLVLSLIVVLMGNEALRLLSRQ
jgi:hypothetical protein